MCRTFKVPPRSDCNTSYTGEPNVASSQIFLADTFCSNSYATPLLFRVFSHSGTPFSARANSTPTSAA